MKTEKIEISAEKVQALCKRFQVKELALFGSAVNEKLHAESDLDFLVEFMPGAQIGFSTLSKLQRELSSLLNRPVDLVPKNGLRPIIRDDVISSAQVLYAA